MRLGTRCLGLTAFAVSLVIGWPCVAPADERPKPDSLDRNYADELPRIAPKSPAEALDTFQVAAGFRIEQLAAEPLVVDPIAMAFDENGRLFVVEMRGYSEDADLNLGRIRLLEDTDQDGRFDRSHVYAEGLSWPTAVTCYDGGIFVGAAPDIHYFKDTDGDNRADLQRVVFTGFGRDNVQGLLNTFKWGLDNRIHGATSSSGAELRHAEDEDGQQRPPLALRGRDFAFDPRSGELQPTSGGAQHGLSFNQWGDKFVCSNSDHIQHVTFLDRYVARNAYFAAPNPRISIAADGPQADVFRTSPVEPWRIVRTRLRVQGLVPGPVEGGGTAAGYFTGSTGVTIYRGHTWPAEFLGWAIVGDVGSNLIHRKRLRERGISYVAERVDEETEFVSSSDIWFRPVQFANAPDGTLYVADMYREVIEHPRSLPPIVKKHLDLTSGRDRGRIYRIVPEGFVQPPLPRLGSADTAELVAALEHDNGWHREIAARLLYERQERAAIPLVEDLVTAARRAEGRIQALYTLDGLSGLVPDILLAAVSDPHPRVRQHAIRLSEKPARESAPLRARLVELTADNDPHVRYQLAFSLGELASGPQRNRALARIVIAGGDDPYLRIAVFSSLEQGAGEVLAELVREESFRESEAGRSWVLSLAAQIGKQQRSEDVAAVLSILRQLADADADTARTIVQGLAAKPGSALEQQVGLATGGQSQRLMQQLLARAAGTALDGKATLDDRVEAAHLLRLGDFNAHRAPLDQLLEVAQPAELQSAALATLATFSSPEVAELLVARWKSFSPALRARAADVMFSREIWLPVLLDAMLANRIAPSDLGVSRLRLLAEHRDAAIRGQAAELLGRLEVGDRSEILADYQQVLQMQGDPARGKAVFKKVCAACHRLDGMGYEIGPNLAAMRNRGREAILTNLLVPNREANPQYLNYAVLTADGRTLTGMIAAETATSVTLRREEDKSDTVLRIDIEEMRSTGVSLMPEGLEKQIDKQAMADLLTYLETIP